ncbi:kelch-like protein 41a [Neocloeon triangulifer]|uniref:kelch-like protein 41a n=1 Tax=Neocloeon triangulifer TaxID=2078957 RepID=UPI00286EEAD0|nr:kelch-like protein 41a [Neocloeon triangulifer]XP_059486602.1 kelch-like protein 41a [Neocloeon triangulifer]
MATEGKPDPDPASTDLWPSRIKEELALLYAEGYFYDCTFEAGGGTTSKVFKCHKLMLARASPFFAKMLYGYFSESFRDKDDPIQISHVQPEIFDLVMKYIYGGETDFKDVESACKVYVISHEWLMNDLMKAAKDFFKTPSPGDVISVHEMYKSLNDKSHSTSLLAEIASNASAVLKSTAWLKSSASTVHEIFQMKHLKIDSEKELFEALYAWGAAGCNKQNEEKIYVEEIRAKTRDALKLIRFMTMDADEFGELCKSDCAKMMTDEDKVKVFMSINLADKSLLPSEFAAVQYFRKLESKELHKFTIVNVSSGTYSAIQLSCSSTKSDFIFACQNSNYYLEGVRLECLLQGSDVDLICNVTGAHSPRVLSSISLRGQFQIKGSKWLTFPQPVHLKANVFYTISVQYLQTNLVNSISSKWGQRLVWNSCDLNLLLPNLNNVLVDFSGLAAFRCPK